MPEHQQVEPPSTHAPNPAKPSQGKPSSEKRTQDIERYMSSLGAGTGVDIGPGAAGEMGNSADLDEAQGILQAGSSCRLEQTLEYPDSGDLPQLVNVDPDQADDI